MDARNSRVSIHRTFGTFPRAGDTAETSPAEKAAAPALRCQRLQGLAMRGAKLRSSARWFTAGCAKGFYGFRLLEGRVFFIFSSDLLDCGSFMCDGSSNMAQERAFLQFKMRWKGAVQLWRQRCVSVSVVAGWVSWKWRRAPTRPTSRSFRGLTGMVIHLVVRILNGQCNSSL